MSDHICPECQGRKVIFRTPGMHGGSPSPCPCCRGAGRISTDHKIRLERAAAALIPPAGNDGHDGAGGVDRRGDLLTVARADHA